MTEPIRPEPSPRDGFRPVPGYNRRGRLEQRNNIRRALGVLSRRTDAGDANVIAIFQAHLASAIVAAEQASAARDAATPG